MPADDIDSKIEEAERKLDTYETMERHFDERRREEQMAEAERGMHAYEAIEARFEQQRRDASVVIATLLVAACAWNVLCGLWDFLGQPLAGPTMTYGVEIIGIVMLLFMVKMTSFTFEDMGIGTKNLKHSLIRSAIISAILVAVMVVAKFVILQVKPDFFAADAPFFDVSRITFVYIFTSILQEYLCRGVTQECLMRIFDGKGGTAIAIGITAVFFASLHIYYGFLMMLGAGLLSVVLGILYAQDRNVWGLSLIHYVIGTCGLAIFAIA